MGKQVTKITDVLSISLLLPFYGNHRIVRKKLQERKMHACGNTRKNCI